MGAFRKRVSFVSLVPLHQWCAADDKKSRIFNGTTTMDFAIFSKAVDPGGLAPREGEELTDGSRTNRAVTSP